jgi:glutathione S-transferase
LRHGHFTGETQPRCKNQEREMTKPVDLKTFEVSAETPIVIYGHPGSGCTQKVLAILAEKGIDAEIVTIDMGKGEHKLPEHVARQPFGVIPAVEIDGFTMYESRGIVRYIEDRFPEVRLTPVDRKARAMMEQFISVEYSYFAPGVGKIFFQCVINPMIGLPFDQAVLDKGRAEVDRVFAVLDRHLETNSYLAGEEFSIAEIDFLPGLFALQLSKQDFSATYPNVAEWAARIMARPSWKKVLGMIQWG